MPAVKRIYRFDKNTGEMVDVTPDSQRVLVSQLEADTKRIRKGLKPRGVQRSAKYPYESETMAVDPEDVPRAQAIAKANGLTTEFNPRTGRPIITSRSNFIQHIRTFGFYERNGTTSPQNR